MKFLHIILIVYSFIDLVSTFTWYNHRFNEPQKQISKTSHPPRTISHLQNALVHRKHILNHVRNSEKPNFPHIQQHSTHNQYHRTNSIPRNANYLVKTKSHQLIHRTPVHVRNNNRVFSLPTKHYSIPRVSLAKSMISTSKVHQSAHHARFIHGNHPQNQRNVPFYRMTPIQKVAQSHNQQQRNLLNKFQYDQRLKALNHHYTTKYPARRHSFINLPWNRHQLRN